MNKERKVILYIAMSIDGGSEVIMEFRNRDLIDEYIILIIPISLGKGIRLFKEIDIENRLELFDSKVFQTALVQ